MTTTETLTVHRVWSLAMNELEVIEKNERNEQQGFRFRGIDTVVDASGPVFRKHGIITVPKVLSIQTERYETKSKAQMQGVIVEVQYTVYGPAGDNFTGSAYGQGSDTGDKAVAKAMSVAYRTFLLEALTIPTGLPEPDASSHERASEDDSRRYQQQRQQRQDATPADKARADLRNLLKATGRDASEAVDKFYADGYGDLKTSTNVKAIHALIKHFRDLAGGSNG